MSCAVARVLTKALKEIETKGWRKGPSYSGGEPCCSVTALVRAGGSILQFVKAMNVLKEAGRIKGDLVEWNDHKSRRMSEVVAAFKKAIALASKPAAKVKKAGKKSKAKK